MEGLGACSPQTGTRGACPAPPRALPTPAPPLPGTLAALFSVLGLPDCVLFVGECELNPEGSAGNTNSRASWHPPPGLGAGQPSWLRYRHGAFRWKKAQTLKGVQEALQKTGGSAQRRLQSGRTPPPLRHVGCLPEAAYRRLVNPDLNHFSLPK